jgi:putative tryptophan/tyrosine transport system substrate-binding protein
MANSNLESKRLQVLKDAVSTLKRVAILHDPSMGSSGLADAQSAREHLRLKRFFFEAGDPVKFAAVFVDIAN